MDSENFKRLLELAETQTDMSEYFTRLKINQDIYNNRIERFHEKYGNDLDAVVEKLLTKYNSDSYRDREFKTRHEPREDLLWFVFDYAQKYCQSCDDKKYWNSFTAEAFYVGSYVFSLMIGQGSALLVKKQEETE